MSTWIGDNDVVRFFENLRFSKAQLRQDLFVLSELEFKEKGFFVEFGATDGVHLSNTHLLEARFQWEGILAEPAKIWHSDLRRNRRAAIETDCVWSVTGQSLWFNEVSGYPNAGELSTLDRYTNSDIHGSSRKASGQKYKVKTISLLDMLRKHGAPQRIDYLSIDTEGSEFEILRNLDFDEFDIKIITCEHNFTDSRVKVFDLLSRNGYIRKFEHLSLFDDWYVKV